MANTKTIIEINGNKYDAATGQLLHKNNGQRSGASPGGHILDGIKAHPAQAHAPADHGGQRKPRRHPATGHVVHHKPQRSQTLMRTAVKKPVVKQPHTPAVHEPSVNSEAVSLEPLHSIANARRFDRAMSINKSDHISRFGVAVPKVSKRTEHLAVQSEPKAEAVISHPSTPLEAPQPKLESIDPIIRGLQQSAPLAHKAATHTKGRRRIITKFGHGKYITAAGATLVVVIAASLIAYQRIPTIAMRVAAAKAGFDARLPEYRPSGYALADPIAYGPGEITVNFRAGSDEPGYKITQRPSKWDSETLLDKFVNSIRTPYQTYQGEGKTIYIYNESDATWVEDGVWYQIAGNGVLSSDQLLRIASSL